MSRDINNFKRPEMWHELVRRCAEIGIEIFITCVDRTYQEQVAYFAQGREPLDYVNKYRKLAGLSPIGQTENKRKITWTMSSRHIVNLEDSNLDNDKSEAIDFAIKDKEGKAVWNVRADINQDQLFDYMQVVEIAEAIGFECGARWTKPDIVHLQLPKEA